MEDVLQAFIRGFFLEGEWGWTLLERQKSNSPSCRDLGKAKDRRKRQKLVRGTWARGMTECKRSHLDVM